MPSATQMSALLVLGAGLCVSVAQADEYFNSSEPGCDGSDPTVLWCDDFEDGSWYVPADGINASDDGWAGYRDAEGDVTDLTGNGNFAKCEGRGAAGTHCAAIKGSTYFRIVNGSETTGSGWHRILPAGQTLREFYLRWYFMPEGGPTGCVINHEKLFGFGDSHTFTSSNSDFGFLDSAFESYEPWMGVTGLEADFDDYWRKNNVGNVLKFQCNHWYYMEVHVKLSDPKTARNGIYQLWMDDCGTDGLGCTGPGTLRADHTDVMWNGKEDNINWVSFWFWASSTAFDPSSQGDRRIDQIIAATHRIGPMGARPRAGPKPLSPPGMPMVLP